MLRPALVSFLSLSVLTGLAYPMLVTGLAQGLMPHQANGSLIVEKGSLLGSELIGQHTEDPKYFWGRLSATAPTPTNASASGASNLSAGNPALREAAEMRIHALQSVDPGNLIAVPVDLVTASASGLDPHISPASAEYQVPRVARLRSVGEAKIRSLVAQATEPPQWGIFGEPRVNVLKLNLSIDKVTKLTP